MYDQPPKSARENFLELRKILKTIQTGLPKS
jgi:hypothetical protein